MEKRNQIFLTYFSVAAIVASLNVIFCTNRVVGTVIVITETIVLLFMALKRKIHIFISLCVVFISNCMEFSSFVGNDTFYNIKSIRIGGMNIGAWMLVILAFVCCLKPIKIGKVKIEQDGLYKYGIGLIKMNAVAAIVGLILIAVNDNNISGIRNTGSEFIACIYSSLLIPATMLLGVVYVITYEKEYVDHLYLVLQATLLANAIQLIVSFAFKIYGYYGGVYTLLSSTLYFVLPLSLLIVNNERFIFKKTTIIVSLIGIILSLAFNASGKLVLTVGLSILFIVFKLLKGKKSIYKVLAIVFVITSIIFIPIVVNYLLQNSVLFKSKYTQALSLFQFNEGNWLNNLSESPRSRVEEFRDVFIEFANKPWLVLTGKGYLGSIVDHTGYFSTLTSNKGLFSDEEWRNGTYYNLHELVVNILMFGIMGVVYSISLLRYSLKNISKNTLLIMGIYWFFLLYGYSFTLSCYGVLAFYIGLLHIPESSNNQSQGQMETLKSL